MAYSTRPVLFRDPQVVARMCKKVARFSLFFSTGMTPDELFKSILLDGTADTSGNELGSEE
jgi:6-phosphogluconolactonase/glucosamine-6-phosphate isomerase/deaminase